MKAPKQPLSMRRAELAAIRVEHLELCDRGLRLTLPLSKGERSGGTVTVAIPYGTAEKAREINALRCAPGDRPEIWGIMTIGIGPVRYVAGWGSTDGMDAAFGWDGD